MSLIDGTTRCKGKYNPPVLRVYGEDGGVPFTKVFRSRRSLRRLEQRTGVRILASFDLSLPTGNPVVK